MVLNATGATDTINNNATVDLFTVSSGETRKVQLSATSSELMANADSSFYTMNTAVDNNTYFGGMKLFYFGARYYDSELGIFISTDPQDVFWNTYSYCGGNPVYFIDPDGEDGGVIAIIAAIVCYLGFSIKNQVNGMDPSKAWNIFSKEWWTGEEGKEGTGTLNSIPRTEFGVDSDKGPYTDVGGNHSYPVYDSKRKRSDQQSIADFNNKARNITENVNSSNQEFYPKIGIDQSQFFTSSGGINPVTGVPYGQPAPNSFASAITGIVLNVTNSWDNSNLEATYRTFVGVSNVLEGATLIYSGIKMVNPSDAAARLGYTQRISPQKAPFNSHGQPVFKKGNKYITPDVDQHKGGIWKMFNTKGQRLGTYDENLNRVGN